MRNKIDYNVDISIRIEQYKDRIRWKDLKSIADRLEDNDIIINLGWKEEKKLTFWGDQHDSDEYQYVLYLTVERTRFEYDEEYVERLKREEERKRQIEKDEYETYLKLKGKFEK